jgi:hypothetical protein
VKVISAKIGARRKESIVVQLEKKVSLISFESKTSEETNKQKIQRLREESLYYARFKINDTILLNFIQKDQEMSLQYRT